METNATRSTWRRCRGVSGAPSGRTWRQRLLLPVLTLPGHLNQDKHLQHHYPIIRTGPHRDPVLGSRQKMETNATRSAWRRCRGGSGAPSGRTWHLRPLIARPQKRKRNEVGPLLLASWQSTRCAVHGRQATTYLRVLSSIASLGTHTYPRVGDGGNCTRVRLVMHDLVSDSYGRMNHKSRPRVLCLPRSVNGEHLSVFCTARCSFI